ncbi:MAG TPA: SDR family oxidoreductase [Candidatus Acidoferrum sp.]|nr:SDR family oxidoreductase [Candidatus Acidoferrum sp.]
MTSSNRFARYPSLEDRVVFITGGGSGIGAVMVEEFARQGSRVGFLDRAVEASRALAARLQESVKHAPHFLECDLTDIAGLQRAFRELASALGAAQVLVNNAANDDRHRWEDVTPAYWDERMAVNLRHQFFAIQAVAPGMKAARSGSIINMSSISWMIPATNMPVYVTAKSAVIGLTRTMARELGPDNIRVNSLVPGAIVTERQTRLWRTPEYERIIIDSQCLKRAIQADEVARMALFLAADDSSAVTEQAYIVDGGWV